MYKWHLSSAIGRGRPVANDICRVADGIAASLRQFSISASRTSVKEDALRVSRTQRSAEAIKEINSLAPPQPKGIDARSLAAKPPPQAFTIRRVDETPRGRGNFAARGGSSFQGREGPQRGGTAFRGRDRDLARGRGAGARGRGRGAKTKRRGGRQMGGMKREEETDLPWSKEEIEWQDTGHQMAWAGEYTPETSAETLEKWRPAIASGSAGLAQSVMYKVEVATRSLTQPLRHAEQHLEKLSTRHGMTLFESEEARAVAQAFKDQKRQAIAEKRGKEFVPENIGTLSKEQQSAILSSWVGGHYEAPKSVEVSDVLGQVELYAKRNETYLPQHTRKLQDKLRSLLPAASAPKSTPVRTASPA